MLKELIPRMIEDMLKLTVDVLFPKHTKKKKLKKRHMKSTSNIGNRFIEEKEDEIEDISPDNEEQLEKLRKAKKRIHPVRGYEDTENMWEKLINLEKCPSCPPN